MIVVLLSEHPTKKAGRSEGMRLRRAGTMCFLGRPAEVGHDSKAAWIVYTWKSEDK